MDPSPTLIRPGGPAPTAWCGAPLPDDESQRLFFLRSTGLLDTTASAAFDRITRLASTLFEVPISLISLVDEHRQWFKSRVGLEVDETPREVSFCAYCVSEHAPLVVPDARQDARFAGNALVTGAPGIRFYAGAPLVLPTGHVLGSLCIIDTRPREFGAAQQLLLQDLAALVMSQIDLHQLAGRVHEVTRLPNRTQLASDLQAACDDARAGAPCTLMLLDLMGSDQLQSAVRAIGIGRLESALRAIASQLMGWLPAGAALYHVSESRLAVLVLHGGDDAPEGDFAPALLARFNEPLLLNGLAVQLHVDAGLVRFRLLPGEADDALRRASTALYGARAAQQQLAWHAATDDAPHQRAYALLHSIPQALAAGEFRLVYQPKLNLRTGRFSGVEALARWRSVQHGDVSPAEFVALIESTALIHEFTEWVLHQALAQLAAWRAQGLELTMAVNVSARNLEHPHFLRMLRNACALHDVPAPALHLECTENAVIAGTRTARVLQEVLALGVSISLDDFGVGYSNLACLHSLPVQLLKLDQSLIKPIAADARALALVRSLIQMGHTLGYRLLAEGVESAEVLDILAREGCDAAQGYHLSRPLEAPAAADFLRAAPAVAAPAASAG